MDSDDKQKRKEFLINRNIEVAKYFVLHSEGFKYSDLKEYLKRKNYPLYNNFNAVLNTLDVLGVWEDDEGLSRKEGYMYGCLFPERIDKAIKILKGKEKNIYKRVDRK